VAAIAKANANSNLSLTFSTAAVDAYLAGKPLSSTQYAQVMKAINSIGYPPGGAVGAPVLNNGGGSSGGTSTGGGTSNGGGTSTGGGISTGGTVTTTMTRAQWRQTAIAIANQNSNLSLTFSTTAVDAYLAGKTLSATQKAQVDKAIAKIGLPPAN
jgi:hypothetical protein